MPTREGRLNAAVAVAGGGGCALGLVVLAGWHLGVEPLVRFGMDGLPMTHNAAVCFVLLGLAMLLTNRGHGSAAVVSAAVAVILSGLTLVEFATGWDLGIDQFLVKQWISVVPSHPGRMAPQIAIATLLTGLGVPLLKLGGIQRHAPCAVALMGAVVVSIGADALVNAAAGIPLMLAWGRWTRLGSHTSVGCLMLGLGLLALAWLAHKCSEELIPGCAPVVVFSTVAAFSVMEYQALQAWGRARLVAANRPEELSGFFPGFELASGIATAGLLGLTVRMLIVQKRAQQEIHRLNAQLERRVVERTAQLDGAMKELEAFSYSVSHDLRAPLRTISGFAQILLEDYRSKLDEEGLRVLGRMQAGAVRMGELIDGLLKLSRVSRAPLNRETVELSALAAEVVAELQGAQPERRIRIDIEPGLTVRGDPELLRVVLQNLLGNAWKFTGRTENPRVEMGATEHEGRTAFFVRDNGAGFEMQYSDKLFGEFQRLHASAEFEGTGIGLATVRRILTRHGGRAWAQAQPDHGATFYFQL